LDSINLFRNGGINLSQLVFPFSVFCTEIFRIPIAGQVDICCFDKTGTLTSDEMQLRGVRLVNEDAKFGDLVEPDASIPWPPTLIMAACHSLALAGSNSSNVIGDPLEKVVMKNTGYKLLHNHVLHKKETTRGQPSNISILHRFGFTSRLKRMTVLAREDSNKTVWALTKGMSSLLSYIISF
jgi:cation-transporting ATPase 13A1